MTLLFAIVFLLLAVLLWCSERWRDVRDSIDDLEDRR
jgi:hypothetical protein